MIVLEEFKIQRDMHHDLYIPGITKNVLKLKFMVILFPTVSGSNTKIQVCIINHTTNVVQGDNIRST